MFYPVRKLQNRGTDFRVMQKDQAVALRKKAGI